MVVLWLANAAGIPQPSGPPLSTAVCRNPPKTIHPKETSAKELTHPASIALHAPKFGSPASPTGEYS